jgi:hypothetical protein
VGVDLALRVLSKVGYTNLASSLIRSTWTFILTPPTTQVFGEIAGFITGRFITNLLR